MATYEELAKDVRTLVPALNDTDATDKAVVRFLWRALTDLVSEAAALRTDDPRMPRSTSAMSIPSDLTDGFTLPTDMLHLNQVQIVYSENDERTMVKIVESVLRDAEIAATPAAYIGGGTLYPIPADGSEQWTDANIESSGWDNLTSVTAEYVPEPAEPTAISDTVDVDNVFHRAAIYRAAGDLAAGLAPGSASSIMERFLAAKDEVMASLSLPTHSGQHQGVVEVY